MDDRQLKIIKPLIDQLAIGAKNYPSVEKIILFGSRARGDAEERSDLDIAIICPHASEKEWLAICDYIDDLETLLEIDVVRFDTASDDLQKKILNEGRVIYEQC